MVLGTLIRYGLPFSFVYCTIYQQDIWREGDEKLILEQKRTWRNFFNMIDCGYSLAASKLNLSAQNPESTSNRLNLVAKLDSMNLTQCWNAKVMSAFSKLNESSLSVKLTDFTQWASPPAAPTGSK